MNLNQIFALNSERLIKAACSSFVFGLKGKLTGQVARYERTLETIKRYEEQHRPIPARLAADRDQSLEVAQITAEVLASTDALMNSRFGTESIDFSDIKPPKIGTEAQLAEIAAVAKVPVDLVKKTRLASAERQYQQAVGAASLAESLFWEAKGQMNSTEIKVSPTLVANALERTRLFILGWSQPDFSELALMALDDATIAAEQEKEEGAGEGSRALDEQLLGESGMRDAMNSGK